ncbi:hypothetical protein [Novosphingobium sp. AAP93]|uniref:hypothetical protein n=1 Tax=Novosphingobium sp. AAP93 TaxID=1523427 RepID=UPI0006B9623F|nr:hypothetical protein [Novosphingobium sp. AAP93]
MIIRITKGSGEDHIAIERSDGTRVETRFPWKGPVPHDAVHVIVERELGLVRGFWGLVAEGRHPQEIQALAKAGGHASASRADVPDAGIIELLQAERLVECYEALLWGGGGTLADVLAMAGPSCASSHVVCPIISAVQHDAIVDAVAALAVEWRVAPRGHVREWAWP